MLSVIVYFIDLFFVVKFYFRIQIFYSTLPHTIFSSFIALISISNRNWPSKTMLIFNNSPLYIGIYPEANQSSFVFIPLFRDK